MVLTPLTKEDLRIIGFNLSKICYITGFILFLPTIVAVLYSEFDTVPYFLIGSAASFILGSILYHFLYTKEEMELKHALVMAALAWLLAPLLASIPIWLSHSMASLLDACFEGISGFTGTGLTLVPDIDHMSRSINFLRHFLQFVGDGIGIIVISLSILGRTEMSSVLAFRGEAKEIGIRPSIVRTSRIIIGIGVMFLALGTVLFTVAGIQEGLDPGQAFFDGLNHAMTGYATGGFTTHSQSLLYYHSLWIELAAMVTMIIGALNFNLHYAVLGGRRSEILRNLEVRVLVFAMLAFGFLVSANLMAVKLYPTTEALFRKGFFQVISAQTTTGFQTVPPVHLMLVWPVFSILILSVAMLLGGSANSTSGGVKMLRVGVLLKSLVNEIKRSLLPSTAVVGGSFHHVEETPLTDKIIRGAAVISLGYLLLFSFGTMITVLHGYGLEDAMFETASALGNVGLSSGITSPAMPALLKVTYMFLMWAGKLEVIAVFVLIGFILLALRRGIK
ncbi:MAG: TrkH family potassium uptake protein [Candidatus Hadarchaeum sp.]|uniref:TrkH family potassium uptake protein n=1 Tax=Candidatus Hadarchaeum sp. TaxID=2883567 RepID=UPI003D0AEEFE